MKILARTPTELIIRDSAIALRAFGLFLIGLGSFAVFVGMQGQDGVIGIVPVVIGVGLVVCGLGLVVLPSRKTFAFSKADRLFIIARERIGAVERQTIPLDDITDVSLEESKSDEGGTMYRVCVTLADEQRIPWTSYYTIGHDAKRAVVDLVRDFLGLGSSTTER